ncbi:25S rRNA (adenine645-N1)-methyltransferase [Microbotryomycetes sp. JL201]|nr:25S rRNA (adenine645-N1)-methyltransferase [Microbotryomycetes sp. JL201]
MLFDTPGLPPPAAIVTDKSAVLSKKRKRHAAPDRQAKAGKVAGAEINLDKLIRQMDAVDSAASSNKPSRPGKDKKLNKDNQQQRDSDPANDNALKKPSLQQQQQRRLDEMSQQRQPANSSRHSQLAGEPAGKKRRTTNRESTDRPTLHARADDTHMPNSSKRQNKAQRQQKQQQQHREQQSHRNTADAVATEKRPHASSSKHAAPTRDDDSEGEGDIATNAAPQTALQTSLRAKLAGGKFRLLNEKLYTTSGAEAAEYMKLDGAFDDYHAGFRSQASHWPVHPLTLIQNSLKDTLEPNSLVADFGCGDAALARQLVKAASPLKVISFDLVSKDGWVVEAECSSVPLPGGRKGGQIVDAVVCSLSLMGTDWIAMVREAHRVLKDGGQFKIAEVTSRFSDNIDTFVEVVSSVGFQLINKDSSNTHFVMFDFVKDGSVTETSQNRSATNAKASTLLKPCIYKRR